MNREDNIILSKNEFMPTTDPTDKPPQIRLADVEVTDQNVALNLIVSFLSLAQKRGSFTIDESSKIWECIKKFQIPPPPTV